MLENIEAVIFDLDGTLVDSMWVWVQVDIDYLKMKNKHMPMELHKDIEGKSMGETAVYFKEVLDLPDDIETIMKTWNEMAKRAYENDVSLKPGVQSFLQLLREKGIKTGIATSNSKELLDAVTRHLSLDAYIDIFLTGDEVARGKPSPDIYLEVAKRLDIASERCLVFEDVPAGIMAGKAAGMKVCAVYDEASAHLTEEKIKKADYFVHTMAEIKG